MMLYKTFITNCKSKCGQEKEEHFQYSRQLLPTLLLGMRLRTKSLTWEGPGAFPGSIQESLHCTVRNTSTTSMCLSYFMCINVDYPHVFYGPEKNGLIATSTSILFLTIMCY